MRGERHLEGEAAEEGDGRLVVGGLADVDVEGQRAEECEARREGDGVGGEGAGADRDLGDGGVDERVDVAAGGAEAEGRG